MSALLGAAVCCLALRFEWEGQELRAGRRPFYGVEVPNVEPASARAASSQEAILYPLSPAPLRYLAEMSAGSLNTAVVLEPPLPPVPGKLRVRISLEACADPALAKDQRLRCGPGAREFGATVRRVIRHEGPPPKADSEVLARGELSDSAPLDVVLAFPRPPDRDEQIDLTLSSKSDPDLSVRLYWHRALRPRKEPAVWRSAPRPHGPDSGDR